MSGKGYHVGASDTRPWGRWEVLAVGEGFAIKRITVQPGEILSLQYHHHRAEHWIILAGKASVTIGDKVEEKTVNDTVFIEKEVRHRIANVGKKPLVFIEIQSGKTLEEGDIVRLEDNYGRR